MVKQQQFTKGYKIVDLNCVVLNNRRQDFKKNFEKEIQITDVSPRKEANMIRVSWGGGEKRE